MAGGALGRKDLVGLCAACPGVVELKLTALTWRATWVSGPRVQRVEKRRADLDFGNDGRVSSSTSSRLTSRNSSPSSSITQFARHASSTLGPTARSAMASSRTAGLAASRCSPSSVRSFLPSHPRSNSLTHLTPLADRRRQTPHHPPPRRARDGLHPSLASGALRHYWQ